MPGKDSHCRSVDRVRCRAAARYDEGRSPRRRSWSRRPSSARSRRADTPQLVPSAGIDRPAHQRGAPERSRLRRRPLRRGLRPGQLSYGPAEPVLLQRPGDTSWTATSRRARTVRSSRSTPATARCTSAAASAPINGRVTGPVAKLDPATGVVDTGFNPPFTTGAVNQVILKNGVLYVGGTFPGHLLALNPDTGANTGDINFTVSDPIPNAFGPVAIFKFAITNAGDRLVATGNFQQVNGSSRTRVFVADIDTTTGRPASTTGTTPASPSRARPPSRGGSPSSAGSTGRPTAATSSSSAPARSRGVATSGTPRRRSTPPTRRCATGPAGST